MLASWHNLLAGPPSLTLLVTHVPLFNVCYVGERARDTERLIFVDFSLELTSSLGIHVVCVCVCVGNSLITFSI